MNPHDEGVKDRHEQLKTLLLQGVSARAVSEKVGLSRKRVYDLAHKYKLPFNPPIKEGGAKEAEILRLTVGGFTPEEIGTIHNLATARVEDIIRRVHRGSGG